MLDFMNITKALSDENRVRILLALVDNELCVCQIIELLELAPSTISKHISILKQARLLESRKDGRWMYYKINNDKDTSNMIKQAIEWTKNSIENSSQIIQDKENLKEILKIDQETLCKQQNKRS